MTEEELVAFIAGHSAEDVLAYFEKQTPKDRAKHKKKVLSELKRVTDWKNEDRLKGQDLDPFIVAMYAVASLTDLKRLSWIPRTEGKLELGIFQRLKPDWLEDYVLYALDDNLYNLHWLPPIWRAGLVPRPNHDNLILWYYVRYGAGKLDPCSEAEFLSGDVWRFFEVGGGGDASLANSNQYGGRSNGSWTDRLVAYCEAGTLDRQRLLDASLDALDRDFHQYVARWYSQFHLALTPTLDEQTAHFNRYVGLVSSAIPPTVSFALKQLLTLDKAGRTDAATLIAGLEPALTARAKGTVTMAIRLLLSAVKRLPDQAVEASLSLCTALITEDAKLQDQVITALEKLGQIADPAVQDTLAGFVPLVAASVRPRLVAVTGAQDVQEQPISLEIVPVVATPIAPLTDAQTTFDLLLQMFENARDPFQVELAFDGLTRFGAQLKDIAQDQSPLVKRAKQIVEQYGASVVMILAKTVLNVVGLLNMDDDLKNMKMQDEYRHYWFGSLNEAITLRSIELGARPGLPMLSLPEDTFGMISVPELVRRLEVYDTAGSVPGDVDMAFALMRLPKENRRPHPKITLKSEAGRALSYALGQTDWVGTSPVLWSAAWHARVPMVTDPKVAKLFKDDPSSQSPAIPFCGVETTIPFKATYRTQEDTYSQGKTKYYYFPVFETVPIPNDRTQIVQLSGLFAFSREWSFAGNRSPEDVAWAGLLHPTNLETYFRGALLCFDPSKLSNHPHRAFLDPFFRPGPCVGPFGTRVLARFLVADDKSVIALTQDAILAALKAGRLTSQTFSAGFQDMLHCGGLKTSRWTKPLKYLAEMGAGSFVCEVMANALTFAPENTPKDMGGLIELYYELCLAHGTESLTEDTVACLKTIPGGGKIAKFAKKLIALT